MGLDMYLEARKYVGKIDWLKVPNPLPEGASYDDYEPEAYKKLSEMFPENLVKHRGGGSTVSINIGYWRKANQIHNWFVNNVQNGEDDCSEYLVEREQLIELLSTIKQVLEGDKDTAKNLLPVVGGFFFGNYDEEEGYDQYYYQNLKETKTMLEDILSDYTEANHLDYDIYYQSSW